MNLAARKLNFIEGFLRISDEETIKKFEHLLVDLEAKKVPENTEPMTMDDLYSMIDQAEDDIKNGRVIETKELLKKVETWK